MSHRSSIGLNHKRREGCRTNDKRWKKAFKKLAIRDVPLDGKMICYQEKSSFSPAFTIIELLIVIVIIAILTVITLVAYNGIQQRARDSQRGQDVQQISQALEEYYIDHGSYPPGSGSTVINSGWSTTADASWSNLATYLSPYISKLPSDPVSTPGTNVASSTSSGYDYAYFADQGGTYCSTTKAQMYLLVYRFEGSPQVNTLIGTCGATSLGPYAGASNYRVTK